jgi:hypothetical protein
MLHGTAIGYHHVVMVHENSQWSCLIGSKGKLDEVKTNYTALTNGDLLCDFHRPALAHIARADTRWRPALALARSGCIGSVLDNAWGVLTYERRGKDKN